MNERRTCCDSESNEETRVSREDVRDYYSKAAVSFQESLCCPAKYNAGDLSHIPQEVLEISYGCGSPINRAGLREGDVMVDLGCGGGIDCFIGAKYVGRNGRVYGIDMTEEMLETATKNALRVGDNLGFHNVEFKHGFLENIPLEDNSVDLVTSNCVINLSTQKQGVFKEIKRILKSNGRFVIADIISNREVPLEMRNNHELWGECVSGALTLKTFLEIARKSEFHGITVVNDYLWKEVNGIKFYSYILQGYKYTEPEDASCCKTLTATYIGPYKSVDCEGTTYRLGIPVEVDEGTAGLLQSPPFKGWFVITDPAKESPESSDSCCI